MSNVKEVSTVRGVRSEVINFGRTVVLFSDPVSCAPCKALKGPYHEASDLQENVNFLYVNIREAEPELLAQYNIMAVPTMLYFRGPSYTTVDTNNLGTAQSIVDALP